MSLGASRAVLGFYDHVMWDAMSKGMLKLQTCEACRHIRYPPAACCPVCLSTDYVWMPMACTGEILSWTILHRAYFSDHPAPYNVVAVRLDEGPILVSNLTGPQPADSWIGHRVRLIMADHHGRRQHVAILEDADARATAKQRGDYGISCQA